MANKTDIRKALERLSVMPKFVLQENTPEVWFDVLKDLPVDMLEAAVTQYLSESNQFTPVPTAGLIRDKAMDLHFLALGVPTGGEAWGDLQDSKKRSGIVFCETGALLREEATEGANYWAALWKYDAHLKSCNRCNTQPTDIIKFSHPVIAETVKRMGGLEAILTGNDMADRARFIDHYNEVVTRERGKTGMTPQVKEFVVNRTAALLEGGADPVELIGDGIGDVVNNMRKRKDLE